MKDKYVCSECGAKQDLPPDELVDKLGNLIIVYDCGHYKKRKKR